MLQQPHILQAQAFPAQDVESMLQYFINRSSKPDTGFCRPCPASLPNHAALLHDEPHPDMGTVAQIETPT